jgi:lysylphosphatidylglycerol synthetase-like protein (DUF2156 family)
VKQDAHLQKHIDLPPKLEKEDSLKEFLKMKKVFNIMLIIYGGILMVFFGIYTVAGIIRMVERDFVTYFMETLILFLPFIAGAIYIFVAFSGFKYKSSLTKKQVIPLIVAVVFTFLGIMFFFMSTQIMVSTIILLAGLVAPIMYLVKMRG